jgi:hypothetical protein
MNELERRKEAEFEARIERAKEVLRIGQVLVRAAVEGTPQAELLVTWSIGPHLGEPVARNTLWRLRRLLGLVTARGNNQFRAPVKPRGRRDTKQAMAEVRP